MLEHYTEEQVQELDRRLDEATDKIHKLRAALRASTELLRNHLHATSWRETYVTFGRQIAANEAALGGKHDTDQK